MVNFRCWLSEQLTAKGVKSDSSLGKAISYVPIGGKKIFLW